MTHRRAHAVPEDAAPPGYRTLAGPGSAELVIKRSRFIGHAAPLRDEAEARAVLADVQKQHAEASHHCYAYVLGRHDETQRASDAGEPAGTAGRPILETIKKEGLKNTLVVVTRYFGGVLLGAGGLTRAYGQSATAAIQAAGVVRLLPHLTYAIAVDYSWQGTLLYDLEAQALRVVGVDYAEGVTVRVLVPQGRAAEFEARLRDLTNGQATLTAGDEVEVGVPEPRH